MWGCKVSIAISLEAGQEVKSTSVKAHVDVHLSLHRGRNAPVYCGAPMV